MSYYLFNIINYYRIFVPINIKIEIFDFDKKKPKKCLNTIELFDCFLSYMKSSTRKHC